MKKWPDDNKPANFEALVEPLVASLRFAYDVKRKNQGKSVPYRGADHNMLGYAYSGAKKLSAENLRYSEEEQGRDALTEIIGLAVMVGIEQGRRIEYTSQEANRLLFEVFKSKLGLE